MTRRQYSPSRNYIFIIFALAVAAAIGTGASASPNPNPGAPQNAAAPTVSGNAVQGQTLTVATGSWTGQVQSYSYAWQRCSTSCAPIAGASDASYTLAAADVGANISAVVYASGKKGSSSATSNAVGPVAPLPAAAPPPPPPASPAPTIAITAPSAGSTVSGKVAFQATVANGTPTVVNMTVDGGSQYNATTSPYTYNGGTLDTTALVNGAHTLAAKAVFADGTSVSTSESVTVQNTTSTSAPPTTPTSRIGLAKFGASLTGFANLDKYGLVIVSGDGVPQARTLTNARTLIYTNASGLHSEYTEGLSYTTASANGCILGRASNGIYVVDHTKATCNQLEADAIVTYAKSVGLKGVFLDDTIPQNPYGLTTPAGWENGMVSFVHLVHQGLTAAGLYLLTNSNAFNDPSLGNGDNGSGDLAWAKLLAPDGVMTESWQETRDGTYRLRTSGTSWYQNWDGWQAFEKGVLAAGMDFVGLSYNANAAYGYASMLLNDNGHAYYIHANPDGSDPWSTTWTKNEGAAVDPAGTNPRRFQNGTATVSSTSATASL
jgi:hypothetical protein